MKDFTVDLGNILNCIYIFGKKERKKQAVLIDKTEK